VVGSRVGDLVVVLFGADVPPIFRRDELANRYDVIGGTYIGDIMDGEVMEDLRLKKVKKEIFTFC
jgi:hypothetical protein